ncbi:hypothetical protein BA022_08085 [Diaphorobacter nitroreducens]|nr:hypothetical protein BA022_08085 [Diaphorobacter nitroreducens]
MCQIKPTEYVMQVTALRSYRCYHYPKTPYGRPVASETGVLPFVQVRASSATRAMEKAAAVTGCVIDRAERLEGGVA